MSAIRLSVILLALSALGASVRACAAEAGAVAESSGAVVRVQVGVALARPFTQVAQDGYVYGPRQDYDAAKRETRIYLPYGTAALGGAVLNAALSDPSHGVQAAIATSDNRRIMHVTYRLEFDRPISAFRCLIGPYAEVVLAPSCIAGVEFSVDGTTWHPVGQPLQGVRTVACPLVGERGVIGALDTRLLLLRIYTRDGAHPAALTGPEMYLKLRISGDPSWGDAERTFVAAQNQVWVTSRE